MLTVLMATHNGAGTLPRVLDSYIQLDSPPCGWKLIVVDNASTDETPDILKSYVGKLPLKIIFTEKRGKNIALNEGLKYVEGDLVVFTDDDVVPEQNWLVALWDAAGAHAEYDIFGGKIVPVWPVEPDDWIVRLVNFGVTYAITPVELVSGPVPALQIWGPNMAVRRKLFFEGHYFDCAVGPQEGQYKMGSETDFTCRLEQLGYRCWFVNEAVVGHIIRKHQLERKWIIQRAFRYGRHVYSHEKGKMPGTTRFFRGVPRWVYRQLLSYYLDLVFSVLTNDLDKKFSSEWEISFLKGYIAEARTVAND